MKKTSSLIIFSLFYCVVTCLILSNSALARKVEVSEISSEPFVKVIKRTGKLDFKRTLNLSFKTSGYLSKLYVDEGDSFVKGQVLAELDAFELIAEKNASYARLLQAKKDVARIKSLLAKKLSSQQALDNAETIVETTRAAYKLAQYNVEKAQMSAPFDGVVLARFTELAELQNPNKVALHLAAMHENLVVSVALTSEEVSLIKPHQQVQVSFSQGIITGTVSKIPMLSNSASQLYTIEIFLADINSKSVTVGQQVNVVINSKTDGFIYRLPMAALNSVDKQGKALITIQLNEKNNKQYQQKSFSIEELSNNYIYLSAQRSALPLMVVTQGWQQLKHSNQEQINKPKQTKLTLKKSAEFEK